jgi:hypothetical protein
VRIDKRAHEVTVAQAQLKVVINDFQRKHDLTDIELLQALAEMQSSVLKYMLRYERHGNYETPAMSPKDEED